MPVNEQHQALGDWSVTLRPDTPLSLRQAITRPHAHVAITPAWVDPNLLSDDSILAASRFTGVVLRPGPQLTIGGAGLLWWLGDADDQPVETISAVTSATWATVYGNLIADRFAAGTVAAGGSYTAPQMFTSRRAALEVAALAAGHEFRANPDLTFDVSTQAALYGTVPEVVLTPGGGGRDSGLFGLDADLTVETDWEQWGDDIRVVGQSGYATHTGANGPVSRTPTGDATWDRLVLVDVPDIPAGQESNVAAVVGPVYNQPTRVVAASVVDLGLSDYLHCGDLVYVFDDVDDVRDFDNQVQFAGRAIFPKIMRATRVSWPVQDGMGVYWRDHPVGDTDPTWYDLTPYVEWESGAASVELIDGDPNRFSLSSGTSRGDVVSQAQDRARSQPWNTYTPTWTGSGSNPSIGNGTIVGYYRREGTLGHFQIWIAPGGSTSFGSGNYSVGLPSGWVAASGREQWDINCKWGGAFNAMGSGGVSAGASSFVPQFPNSAAPAQLTPWTPTAPGTFASGTNFFAGGTVELAP